MSIFGGRVLFFFGKSDFKIKRLEEFNRINEMEESRWELLHKVSYNHFLFFSRILHGFHFSHDS